MVRLESHEHTHTPVAPTSEDILRERLTRGEIDEDDVPGAA
ncbi:SHOCT domain-containing protein [Streptomyces luteolifulvus]|jgi:putative membrane protein|nr:hypothetical protein [Streptomyces luteolifulvus]